MLKPPSVNQITSAYTGHMPELTRRVEQDKKVHNGVPQDLRALMAEADMAKAIASAQNQTALNQPQNPPTIAQSLHDQIRQMMQKQPQMQPNAGQSQFQGRPPQAAPQGLPQLQANQTPAAMAPPEPMPAPPEQGLDQLPANVGQSYADGGIIGFATGDEVPAAQEKEAEKDSEGIKKALKFVGGLPMELLKTIVSAPGYGFSQQAKPEAPPSAPAPAAPAAAPAAPAVALPAFDQGSGSGWDSAPAAPAPRPNKMAAQPAPAAPAAPAELSPAEKIMNEAMASSPDAVLRAAEERRNKIQRDTRPMDELMAEYRAEKERLAAPKQGMAALMEYLGQVANAPRGMGSLSAGAYGAAKTKELEQARAQQRHELTKQMLEVGQKKADIGYNQSLDVMGAGDAAKAAALKERYAAAIASTSNALQKEKLAQDLKLELAKLEVHKQQVAAMNKPPAFQQIYSELQRLQPNADKTKLFNQAVSMAGLSSRQESADAQMLDKLNDEMKQLDAAESKLNFVKMTDPKQYAIDKAALDKRRLTTEAMRTQMYARIGGGLPDLNKGNPNPNAASPGQPDYSKLWK